MSPVLPFEKWKYAFNFSFLNFRNTLLYSINEIDFKCWHSDDHVFSEQNEHGDSDGFISDYLRNIFGYFISFQETLSKPFVKKGQNVE